VEQQQKRILDRVWGSVEKAMSQMKKIINSQLQDPTRTVEEQEKTIEYVSYLRPSFWNS
jgi:exocyst complex component 2